MRAFAVSDTQILMVRATIPTCACSNVQNRNHLRQQSRPPRKRRAKGQRMHPSSHPGKSLPRHLAKMPINCNLTAAGNDQSSGNRVDI